MAGCAGTAAFAVTAGVCKSVLEDVRYVDFRTTLISLIVADSHSPHHLDNFTHNPPASRASGDASLRGVKIGNIARGCYPLGIGPIQARGHVCRRMWHARLFGLKIHKPQMIRFVIDLPDSDVM